MICFFFFFFQAEDGIRDIGVTGVQTCALPISARERGHVRARADRAHGAGPLRREEIGRASCRGKSVDLGGRRIIKKKKKREKKTHKIQNKKKRTKNTNKYEK